MARKITKEEQAVQSDQAKSNRQKCSEVEKRNGISQSPKRVTCIPSTHHAQWPSNLPAKLRQSPNRRGLIAKAELSLRRHNCLSHFTSLHEMRASLCGFCCSVGKWFRAFLLVAPVMLLFPVHKQALRNHHQEKESHEYLSTVAYQY